MQVARFGAADLSVLAAQTLATSMPKTVPSAWGGAVPPVTMAGRHRLRPGGLFVCGSNWARLIGSRYSVYQQRDGRLEPREFAFRIDNVCPVALAPWYALHHDNFENLCDAEAVPSISRLPGPLIAIRSRAISARCRVLFGAECRLRRRCGSVSCR
jgi:hypothetical protein